MKAEKYIELLESILKQLTGVKDKEGVAIAIMQEVAKDRRMEEIKVERDKNNNGPATEKQIAYLKKLCIDPEPGITKEQASKLIDAAVASRESCLP